jgi:hypothetical protein
MRIAGRYSFNGGREAIERDYAALCAEVIAAIRSVDAQQHKTKESEERTMVGTMLYSPVALNAALKQALADRGWRNHRVPCEYPTNFYEPDYVPKRLNHGAYRDMDFVKGKLGVEVQFGKYAFMVYNVAAKMTIFRNLQVIEAGIEVVPVKAFADEMSSGVSYYEQFLWDLENRGVSNIDTPVMVLGIDADLDGQGGGGRTVVPRTTPKVSRTRPGPKNSS